jgi:galactokinase
MTGAGFGGCTVNLVAADAVDRFTQRVQEAYPPRAHLSPRVWVCEAADGAGEVA